MDNAINAADDRAFKHGQPSEASESAVRNSDGAFARRVTFLVLWIAVSLPMIWGITKAWEDVQNLF